MDLFYVFILNWYHCLSVQAAEWGDNVSILQRLRGSHRSADLFIVSIRPSCLLCPPCIPFSSVCVVTTLVCVFIGCLCYLFRALLRPIPLLCVPKLNEAQDRRVNASSQALYCAK